MTRTERLAHQEAQVQARLTQQRKQLAQLQAQQRAEARKAHAKRCYLVGQMVLKSVLGALSESDLQAVLVALSPLADTPNPAAVLTSLLETTHAL